MAGVSHVLDKLGRLYPGLSAGQQKVAAYIIHHNEYAAFMTLTELAAAAGVSKSTVERVARQTLHFDSYSTFRTELQSALRATFEPGDRIRAAARSTDDSISILNRTIEEDRSNLKQTLAGLDHEAFTEAVSRLRRARQVYVYGRGVSKAVATLLKERLGLVRSGVYLVEEDPGSARRRLVWLEPDDLVVFISFRSYARETVLNASYAAARGAQVVAITDDVTSPLVPHSHTSLILTTRRDSGMTSSLAPAMSLADALVTSLVLTDPRIAHRMESLTERDIDYLNLGNATFITTTGDD